MDFDVKEYWNKRLDKEFSLQGVGYITFSPFYNKWLYKGKKAVLNKVYKQYLSKAPGKRVLDIGCGTGFFVDYYLKNGCEITGLDISARSVKELKEKYPGSVFINSDISSPEGKLVDSFDIINMWDVMYHQVDQEAFKRCCINIAGMAKPGTYFLLTDFFAAGRRIQPGQHVVFRPMEDYKDIMQELGFKLVTVRPLFRWLNRPYPWSHRFTNILAPFFYLFDRFISTPSVNNLSLAIWRYEGK